MPNTDQPFVQFSRHDANSEDERGGPIAIRPAYVSAIFASVEPGVTIVRMADGRGFKVNGEFEVVASALGHVPTQPEEVPSTEYN